MIPLSPCYNDLDLLAWKPMSVSLPRLGHRILLSCHGQTCRTAQSSWSQEVLLAFINSVALGWDDTLVMSGWVWGLRSGTLGLVEGGTVFFVLPLWLTVLHICVEL